MEGLDVGSGVGVAIMYLTNVGKHWQTISETGKFRKNGKIKWIKLAKIVNTYVGLNDGSKVGFSVGVAVGNIVGKQLEYLQNIGKNSKLAKIGQKQHKRLIRTLEITSENSLEVKLDYSSVDK